MEKYDVRLTKDQITEHFIAPCPFPQRMFCAEVVYANDVLNNNYGEDMQTFRKLLEKINSHHNLDIRQYR